MSSGSKAEKGLRLGPSLPQELSRPCHSHFLVQVTFSIPSPPPGLSEPWSDYGEAVDTAIQAGADGPAWMGSELPEEGRGGREGDVGWMW